MKKYLFTVGFVLAGLIANAQFDSLRWVIGGEISGNYLNQEDVHHSFNFEVKPRAGRVLKNNNVIGLYVGKSYSYFSSDFGYSSYGNGFEYGLFFQKYLRIKNNFFFNVELSAGYQSGESTFNDGTDDFDNSTNSWQMRLAPGIAWKVADKLLLTGSIGGITYSRGSIDNFSVGFHAPALGVNFLFK